MEQQVDFYILARPSLDEALEFAARLCQKVYSNGHAVAIVAKDLDQARQVDLLLWSGPAESFIPHTLGEGEHQVFVGSRQAAHIQLNLNLSQPSSDWQRLLYLVPNDDGSLSKARDLYRYFKQQSTHVKTHKMN